MAGMSEVRDIARQELKRIWMTDPKKLKTVIIDFEERAYDQVVFALILQLPSDVTSVYKQDLQRLGMETNDKMPVAAMDRVKMKMSAQILLFHIKKKFVILYVYCNIIDRRGCEGGFRNGKQDNSSDWNEQFHRNSKESLLLY